MNNNKTLKKEWRQNYQEMIDEKIYIPSPQIYVYILIYIYILWSGSRWSSNNMG